MISIRETTKLRLLSNTVLRLGPNPGRRAVFGVIGIALVAAFAVGFDPNIDLVKQRIPWLALYVAFTLSMLGVALYAKTVDFDAQARTVTFARSMGPIRLSTPGTLSWDEIEGFVLQRLQVLKQKQVDPKERRGGWMAERSKLFRLYIEIAGERILLDDSTQDGSLVETAGVLAKFTGKPYRELEI